MITWLTCYTRDKNQGYREGHGFEDCVETALKVLKPLQAKKETKFDSIVAQGFSGILMAAPIAYALEIPLVAVGYAANGRETMSDRHGERVVNAYSAGKKVVFIDDHISGGNTLERCAKALKRSAPNAQIIGTYCYNPQNGYSCSGWIPAKGHPFANLFVTKPETKTVEEDVPMPPFPAPSTPQASPPARLRGSSTKATAKPSKAKVPSCNVLAPPRRKAYR